METTCPCCGAQIDPTTTLCAACGCVYHQQENQIIPTGMVCYSCGFQADRLTGECPACQAPYRVSCFACGGLFAPGLQLCPHCGHDHFAARAPNEPPGVQPATMLSDRSPMRKFIWPGMAILVGLAGAIWLIQSSGGSGFVDILVTVGTLVTLVVLVIVVLQLTAGGKTGKGKRRREGGMIEVYRTFSRARAEHLRSLLESENIPAFMHNQYVTTINPLFPFRGIQVLVPMEQVGETKAIMTAFGFGDGSAEEDG